jgi:hypothetical protein
MTITTITCDGPGCGASFALAGPGTTHAIRLVAEAREGWRCEAHENDRPYLAPGRDFCAKHADLAEPGRAPLSDRARGRRRR